MHVADSCYQRSNRHFRWRCLRWTSLCISRTEGHAGAEIGVFLLSVCAGDALSSLKALRDAGRFVGKEDTVPLRLLYSRHNHSQITQDELSTRVKTSSGSAQVHNVFRMEREREGGERLHAGCFMRVYVCIDSSPPLPLSSEGKLIIS